MNEFIARRFYTRMDSTLKSMTLAVLEKVFDKWEEEHEPFEFSYRTLFPWVEVLDVEKNEYDDYNAVFDNLKVACRAYCAQEFREKRDSTFRGKENCWYLVPRFTFIVYHEKCVQGLTDKRRQHYPDYLKYLTERMRKEKLSPYQRVNPNDFFHSLYLDFTGEGKVSSKNPVCVFRCLEHFGLSPKRTVGKQPKLPLAFIEEQLKGLYKEPEFLKSLVPDEELYIYD